MKKIICRVALCLAVLGMGATFTSCGTDVVEKILNYLAGGETYYYKGTYSMQAYALNTETDKLAPATEKLEFTGTTVTAVAKKNTAITAAGVDLTLPGTTIADGVTMSDVTIFNLALDETTLSVGSNTTANGTLTYPIDGTEQTLQIYDVTVDADITTDELKITDIIVYFGDEGNYAVRITMPDGKAYTVNN